MEGREGAGRQEIEAGFRKPPGERSHRDLQVISSWLSAQDSLDQMGARRMLEVASVVEMEEHQEGQDIFLEGDESTAFYIIFSGSVVVKVKGQEVALLKAGETFGELGLDNNTQRTATVQVGEGGAKLVKLWNMSYKHILSKYNMDRMQLKASGISAPM
ncbi:unnamed protein product [Discosporangium mesarthrocarpum]